MGRSVSAALPTEAASGRHDRNHCRRGAARLHFFESAGGERGGGDCRADARPTGDHLRTRTRCEGTRGAGVVRRLRPPRTSVHSAWLPPGYPLRGDFPHGVLDVGIAAQGGALAAETLGLGVCYQGSIRNNTQAVIDFLQLLRLVFPVVGMALGWPATSPPHRPRLPLGVVLAWERYPSAPPDDALAEYDRAMIATGIYRGRQVPVAGKPSVMDDYGWLEHSARRMAQATRTELSAALKGQGFDLE